MQTWYRYFYVVFMVDGAGHGATILPQAITDDAQCREFNIPAAISFLEIANGGKVVITFFTETSEIKYRDFIKMSSAPKAQGFVNSSNLEN